jgi:2'-5' RNA ligase
MRLFVAVNLPPALRDRVYADVAPLRDAAPDISWARPELLHFTLKFLGSVADTVARALVPGLRAVAERHPPSRVTLRQLGAFPNFGRPRVVWIGVDDHRFLSTLAGDVELACAPLGFAREARAFTAHATLGRVRRPLSRDAARALELAAQGVHNEYPVSVSSIDLMQSQPGAGGSRYTVLSSYPLSGETQSARTP